MSETRILGYDNFLPAFEWTNEFDHHGSPMGRLSGVRPRQAEATDEMERNHRDSPPHLALFAVMRNVVEAMRMIEWVDSGDCDAGDDLEAIRAVVSPAQELGAAAKAAEYLKRAIDDALARCR